MASSEVIPSPPKELHTQKRVELLLEEYQSYNLEALSLCVDHEEFQLPLSEDFKLNSPYIVVKAHLPGQPEIGTVLLKTPVNHEDSNMTKRLGRDVLVGHAVSTSEDKTVQAAMANIRFPKVLDVRQAKTKDGETYVGSTMEEWIDTEEIGHGIHLVESGVLTTDNLHSIAAIFHAVQIVGEEFTQGSEFSHKRISIPFTDRNESKFWIDYENNPARIEAYKKVFGQQFVNDLGILLRSNETAALYPDNGTRYIVFGNIIPVKLGIDAEGKIVFRDIERTSYTERKSFDFATFLTTLVSDKPRLDEFIQMIKEQNPDPDFLQDLRRGILLDRLGNIVDLLKDPALTQEEGSSDRVFIEQAIANFRQLAEDALYEHGMWTRN